MGPRTGIPPGVRCRRGENAGDGRWGGATQVGEKRGWLRSVVSQPGREATGWRTYLARTRRVLWSCGPWGAEAVFPTALDGEGAAVVTVQPLAGHANVQTAARYERGGRGQGGRQMGCGTCPIDAWRVLQGDPASRFASPPPRSSAPAVAGSVRGGPEWRSAPSVDRRSHRSLKAARCAR